MGYRVLEHTADTGVEVRATGPEELFAEAAVALADTITEAERLVPRVERRLEVQGDDLPDLMVEWLSEVLYRYEVEGLLFSEVREVELRREDAAGWALTALALGEPHDPARHPLKTLVKAVTYHALEVGPEGDGWTARVIFDL